MGCGCKDDGKSIDKNSESIKPSGVVLKLPIAILITILFIVLSPFMVVVIWYLTISAIFGVKVDFPKLLLKIFNKNKLKNIQEDIKEEFTEENYELVDVDIIK